MLYCAYGSNLNHRRLHERVGARAQFVGTALLPGWRLEFRHGVLNIVPEPGSLVPTGFFEVSDLAVRDLDRFEGTPMLYRRERFPAERFTQADFAIEDAQVYVMTAGARFMRPAAEPPSNAYFGTCAEGYRECGLARWLWLLDAMREKAAGNEPKLMVSRRGELIHLGTRWGYGALWADAADGDFDTWKTGMLATLGASPAGKLGDAIMQSADWQPIRLSEALNVANPVPDSAIPSTPRTLSERSIVPEPGT